jgi:competence protein ComEA
LTLKRLIHFLKENLDITRKEAQSTLAFLSVALLSILVYIIVNYLTSSSHTEVVLKTYSAEKPPVKEENAERTFQNKPTITTTAERFRFNPNSASKEEFIRLGIPTYVANSIQKYRDKGGSFRYKTDFKKIYNLKPELYAELYPWIDLPKTKPAYDREEYRAEYSPSSKPEKQEVTKSYPIKETTALQKFDINSADTTQLKKVKGIGSTYASRIIKFRDALGGFHSLNQLEETYGIAPEAVTELKKYALIESRHKTIKINEVDNIKHPTLKFAQAKAIIAYRNQHGPFSSLQDLSKIKLLNEETILKIAPYLSF